MFVVPSEPVAPPEPEPASAPAAPPKKYIPTVADPALTVAMGPGAFW